MVVLILAWRILLLCERRQRARPQNLQAMQDGQVITTNTIYNPTNGQPVSQNISVRDSQGKVTSQNTIGGKLLP